MIISNFELLPGKAISPSTVAQEVFSSAGAPAGVHQLWPLGNDAVRIHGGELHVWSVDLGSFSARKLSDFTNLLSAEERARAQKFYFERDRRRFIASRGVLRLLLSQYLHVRPERLTFCYTAAGKPYLWSASSTPLQFNLSHSDELAVLAFSVDQELGVDLEKVRLIQDRHMLAKCFFAPGEYERLMSLPEREQEKAFFKCWTRKEACLKCTGEGITQRLADFEVSFEPGIQPLVLRDGCKTTEESDWFLQDIHPAEGFVGALAVKARNPNVQTWVFQG